MAGTPRRRDDDRLRRTPLDPVRSEQRDQARVFGSQCGQVIAIRHPHFLFWSGFGSALAASSSALTFDSAPSGFQECPPLGGELLVLALRVSICLPLGDPARAIQYVALVELEKGIQPLAQSFRKTSLRRRA